MSDGLSILDEIFGSMNGVPYKPKEDVPSDNIEEHGVSNDMPSIVSQISNKLSELSDVMSKITGGTDSPSKEHADSLLSNIKDSLSRGFLSNDNENTQNYVNDMNDGILIIEKKLNTPEDVNASSCDTSQIIKDLILKAQQLVDSMAQNTSNDEDFFGVDSCVPCNSQIEDDNEPSILLADMNVAGKMIESAINGKDINHDALLTILDPTKYDNLDEDLSNSLSDTYVTVLSDVYGSNKMNKKSYFIPDNYENRIDNSEFYNINNEQNPQRLPRIPYNYMIWLDKVGETHDRAMARLDEHKNPLNKNMLLNIKDGERSNPIREELASLETRMQKEKLNNTKHNISNNQETRLDDGQRRPWDTSSDTNIDSHLQDKQVGDNEGIYGINIEKRLSNQHTESSDDSTEKRMKDQHVVENEMSDSFSRAYESVLSDWRKKRSSSDKNIKTADFGSGIILDNPNPLQIQSNDTYEENVGDDSNTRLRGIIKDLQDLARSEELDVHISVNVDVPEPKRPLRRNEMTTERALDGNRWGDMGEPQMVEPQDDGLSLENIDFPDDGGIFNINNTEKPSIPPFDLNLGIPDIHMGTARAKYQGGGDQLPKPADEM